MLASKSPLPIASTPYVAEQTTILRMAERTGDWRALAANAIEPNPFYEFDYLVSSARDIEREDIPCVAIYRDGARNADLLGLFPLRKARLAEGALIPALELYRNPFICSTAPLIRHGDPVTVWRSFIECLRNDIGRPRTVIGRLMPASRPAAQALQQALFDEELAVTTVSSFERAIVDSTLQYKEYHQDISANRRKDLRRRMRRLTEMGRVDFRTERCGRPLADAVEAFLELEASGWKGQSGTAITSRPETARLMRQAFNADNAEVDVLSLNGKPIAVACNLVSQSVKHTVKITYDESMRKLSPGALLDFCMLENYLSKKSYQRMDSCATEGDLVGEQWLQREMIEYRVFSVDPRTPSSRIESFAATLRAVERLKGWLKDQISGK